MFEKHQIKELKESASEKLTKKEYASRIVLVAEIVLNYFHGSGFNDFCDVIDEFLKENNYAKLNKE